MSVFILFKYVKECKKNNLDANIKGLYDFKKSLEDIKHERKN